MYIKYGHDKTTTRACVIRLIMLKDSRVATSERATTIDRIVLIADHRTSRYNFLLYLKCLFSFLSLEITQKLRNKY
jgi:hypothetical protein